MKKDEIKKYLDTDLEFNPSTRELKRNDPSKYGFDYVSKCIINLKNEDGSLKESGQVVWY